MRVSARTYADRAPDFDAGGKTVFADPDDYAPVPIAVHRRDYCAFDDGSIARYFVIARRDKETVGVLVCEEHVEAVRRREASWL